MAISRRVVLNGIGQSTTLGALAAALPVRLRAADAAAAAPVTYSLTRHFQRAEGATFDGNIFRDQQIPNMIKAYGKSADRIELRVPVVEPGAAMPQIIATVNIWFTDLQGFISKHGAAKAELDAGMANVTKVVPVEQVDQVLAALGGNRSTVPVESYCYSTYFPRKEGGTFDAAYFAETLYPKVAQTYGSEAVRRIEVTKDATNKSPLVAATHTYINSEAAYDAAGDKIPPLFADVKNYTNITPLNIFTKVHAIG